MPQAAVNLSMVGGRELEQALIKLGEPKHQKLAVRQALKKSAERLKAASIRNYSEMVDEKTGKLGDALLSAKVKAVRYKSERGVFGQAYVLPARAEIGIGGEDPDYYPAFVEYGHGPPGSKGSKMKTVPPKPFIRKAVEDNKDAELSQIGREIGQNIEKLAKKLAARKLAAQGR